MPNHYPSLLQCVLYIAGMILVVKGTPWLAFKIDPIRDLRKDKFQANNKTNLEYVHGKEPSCE